MAQKRFQDWIYLLLLVMHLQAMIGVDFVEFYPESLISAGGPLHFLEQYKEWYVHTMEDPYYPSPVGHFFTFSVYVELLLQFPLAAYLVYSLATSKPLNGPGELAGTMYGAVVGLFTLLVCYDTWHMPGLDEARRSTLFWQVYLPFGVVASLMGVDMYVRLLGRLTRAESKAKSE